MTNIQEILFRHQDEEYGDFTAKLIPTVERNYLIGIRSPEYKKILKEVEAEANDEIEDFKRSLPHTYLEENVLHAAMLSQIKDFDRYIDELEKFLPYVNNWYVSDGIAAKVLDKNHDKIVPYIEKWINSNEPYTQRVAMLFIKKFLLGEDYKAEYLKWAVQLRSEEYYVNMMRAWLMADALVKQWDSAVTFITEKKMDVWTHNKSIQKARESLRITKEQKEYLNGLKR